MQVTAFIGFGEAGQAFAGDRPARAYDRKTGDAILAPAKQADFARRGVEGVASNAAAVADATLILSLVTADQALAAAVETARTIALGALFCDLNSVAPDTKWQARDLIEATGGRYVDVAVMAPVHPARLNVPLLVAGPHATDAAAALRNFGFTNIRIVDGPVGKASAIKMIRSVMVKGLEALTAEWILAARAAGIVDEAVTALNASWPGVDWAEKADYNLERMMVHGLRRADEMEEVVRTLDALGTGSVMTRGTVERQRAIGDRALTPGAGLSDKVDAILGRDINTGKRNRAA